MSTDKDSKKDQVGGDWNSALEEWDESPLVPALADDLTPAPAGIDSTPPAEPVSGAEAVSPTVRPPDGPPVIPEDEDDDEDECTVVGEIPAELIADSIRGLGGSASGLGQIFSRGSQPTFPAEDEVSFEEHEVSLDDSEVFSSAPKVSPDARATETPSPREDQGDPADEVFDPFADLREDIASPVHPAIGAKEAQFALDATPLPDAEATPLPRDEEAGVAASEGGFVEGPKLLEPGERHYPQDEVTEVFAAEAAAKKLVERGARTSIRMEGEVELREPLGVPRSVPPPPIRPPSPQWTDERDAVAHVLERDLRADWETRAAWFAEEAAELEDGAQRARMMLAISELCAMLGEDDKGVAVARAAREHDPNHPLAHRQARYTMVRERRWDDVLGELEAEVRTAPTPEAKAHSLLVSALLTEQLLNDEVASGKHLDMAARVLPSDPRPYLEKLLRFLNDESGKVTEVRWPDEPAVAPLAAGATMVGKLRKAQAAPAVPGEDISVYEAIPRAKAALRVFDMEAAARALRALEAVRGMGGGALWLAASLAGQVSQSRQQSVALFDKLSSGPHASVAMRLMALRAVEMGNLGAIEQALSVPGATSFLPADRIVLAALFHEETSSADPFITLMLGQEKGAVLGAAARAALTNVTPDLASSRMDAAGALGDSVHRAAWALARGVVAGIGTDDFFDRVKALCEGNPDAWIARLLDADLAIHSAAPGKLVDLLGTWGMGVGGIERDRALAAGLVAELIGDRELATEHYQRAFLLDPAYEASLRTLSIIDRRGHVQRLIDLAGQTSDGAKGSIFAIEAALCLGPSADAYIEQLRLSQQLDATLPFASVLGERVSRMKGDMDGVFEWLRSRRESTEDPVEASYDACREAMLMVERDVAAAAMLMEQASRARPSDVALRALYERFTDVRPEDWVAWRIERAAESDGVDKARLLLEAALECERTGRFDEAAKLALQASDSGAGDLATHCLARCELAGAASSFVTDQLMEQVRREDLSPEERREAQERLAELDEVGRGDLASALLWHRSILEHFPQHLPSLRRIEHAYIGMGRDDDLEAIASELVRCLQGPEADAHAVLASRIRFRESSWAELEELCKAAAEQPNPSLWALRSVFSHACVRGDDPVIVHTAKALSERCDSEVESAALLVQAAQGLARQGEHEEASQILQMALDREPRFVQAHLDLVDVLVKTGEYARAAEELEALARKSNVDLHRAELWYRAGVLWVDEIEEADRGRHAFEEASDIDIEFRDVFDKLCDTYTKVGDATALASLMERRLDTITDPEERIGMEVLRGRALAEVGEVGGAKRALAAALDMSPDHVPALEAFASVCAGEQDWSGTEQALIRLVRLVPDPERQADIYRQLGGIYLDHIPDFERAEAALREVLKRNPDDGEAQTRLVDVFRETGEVEKAVELCTSLIDRASSPEAKRAGTIQLAFIHEQLEGDVKKARDLLERTHKQAPTSGPALRALAEFHQRQGNDKPLEILLDRASKDAARALRTGRFNRDLFSVLETVAYLRADEAAAHVARAAVAALEGGETHSLPAFGPAACSVNLDDLLTPDIVSPSLRALLKRTGTVLDAAFPMDLKALRAAPLPPTSSELQHAIVEAAAAMGLQDLQIFVSPALGPTCVPIQSTPPIVVLGSSMITTNETAVRDFLLIRALKIVQTRGCVLSRTAPIDLMPLVAALIKTFAPSFEPAGVDARRFSDSFQKLSAAKPSVVDPDITALALEMASSLDNRASTLNVAINGWGDRAALLAQGFLNVALKAIAWSGGHPSGPPASGPERMTWIGRNAEARDLIVFLASDDFGEACKRLG